MESYAVRFQHGHGSGNTRHNIPSVYVFNIGADSIGIGIVVYHRAAIPTGN